MSFDDQFQNNQRQYNNNFQPTSDGSSGLAGWVVRHSGGMVKDILQANYLIYFFVGMLFIISFFVVMGAKGDVGNDKPNPAVHGVGVQQL